MNTQEKIEALWRGEMFMGPNRSIYGQKANGDIVYWDTIDNRWKKAIVFNDNFAHLKPYTQPEPEVLDTLDKVAEALRDGKMLRKSNNDDIYAIKAGHLSYIKHGRAWADLPAIRVTALLTSELLNATIYDPDATPNPKKAAVLKDAQDGQEGGEDEVDTQA